MSDKTNAAIAAEQQAAATEESSAAQQAEALPAATLEELEEFDIGSVATITETGEIVEDITVTEQPDIFKVDL